MNNLKFRIAMVSDFFYPNIGGVEGHIYELSQNLLQLGHKVIIITHAYGENNSYCRQGVRYLQNNLKVYYIPMCPIYLQCILPTVFMSLPVIRDILIRENIEIVHCHSAFSTLALESLMHAKSLRLKTVFTDHSLFGFADLSSVLMNKLLQWAMVDTDRVVCVSHTSKENTVIRARLDPLRVFVIPNAVDADAFTPDPSRIDPDFVTVVVVSRLVYRKGVDLLIGMIPRLCQLYPTLRFIVGGDGPKRLGLEEIRERNNLYDRVVLKGALAPSQVSDVLRQGDIFVSTSLTEAFCIAIVEAASCGLRVVSTDVGGVREVLPSDLIELCEPSTDALVAKMSRIIDEVLEDRRSGRPTRAFEQHRRVRGLYTWADVARRTERVYEEAAREPDSGDMARLKRHCSISPIGGKLFGLVLLLEILVLQLLSWWRPAQEIRYFSQVDGIESPNQSPQSRMSPTGLADTISWSSRIPSANGNAQ